MNKQSSPSPRARLAAIAGAAFLGLLILYAAGFAPAATGGMSQALRDARVLQGLPVGP